MSNKRSKLKVAPTDENVKKSPGKSYLKKIFRKSQNAPDENSVGPSKSNDDKRIDSVNENGSQSKDVAQKEVAETLVNAETVPSKQVEDQKPEESQVVPNNESQTFDRSVEKLDESQTSDKEDKPVTENEKNEEETLFNAETSPNEKVEAQKPVETTEQPQNATNADLTDTDESKSLIDKPQTQDDDSVKPEIVEDNKPVVETTHSKDEKNEAEKLVDAENQKPEESQSVVEKADLVKENESEQSIEEPSKEATVPPQNGKVDVRNYLNQNIVPIVRSALVEMAKEQPVDSLEFLVNYLLEEKKRSTVLSERT